MVRASHRFVAAASRRAYFLPHFRMQRRPVFPTLALLSLEPTRMLTGDDEVMTSAGADEEGRFYRTLTSCCVLNHRELHYGTRQRSIDGIPDERED